MLGYVWVRHVECWGACGPVAGICRWSTPSGSLAGFLREFSAASSIHTCLIPSESPICCSPSFLLTPNHVAYDSIPRWEYEGNEPLLQGPNQLEKLGARSHMLSVPPWEKSLAVEALSWPYAVLPWGKDDTGKIKHVSLTYPECAQINIYLFFALRRY